MRLIILELSAFVLHYVFNVEFIIGDTIVFALLTIYAIVFDILEALGEK